MSSGATATADFTLTAVAATLSEVVVTGYGAQRREAITGSVAQVDADDANEGVIANPNQLVQGRVTGVQMVTNNGEPGAGVQIRVRGGTSISASNDPLYVVDGVPLQNEQTVASPEHGLPRRFRAARSTRSTRATSSRSRSSRTPSATAIYGSRGANGVILIQTKRGSARALNGPALRGLRGRGVADERAGLHGRQRVSVVRAAAGRVGVRTRRRHSAPRTRIGRRRSRATGTRLLAEPQHLVRGWNGGHEVPCVAQLLRAAGRRDVEWHQAIPGSPQRVAQHVRRQVGHRAQPRRVAREQRLHPVRERRWLRGRSLHERRDLRSHAPGDGHGHCDRQDRSIYEVGAGAQTRA